MISVDGEIKLADFGVAATLSDIASTDEKDFFRGTSYWSTLLDRMS